MLVVSQFTLPAKLGPKQVPDFRKAMAPAGAQALYNQLVTSLRAQHQKKGATGPTVAEGVFGADMQVHLVNDGPVTIVLDSPEPPAPSTALPSPTSPESNLSSASTPAASAGEGAAFTADTAASSIATAALDTDAQPPTDKLEESTATGAPSSTPSSSATMWPAHGPDDSPAAVAEAFHRDGFVVLQSLLPLPLVERAKKAAAANFTACQSLIAARELEFGMHTAAGFREIVQRNLGRFEMPFGLAESPVFQAPELVQNPRLIAVLDAILGDKVDGANQKDASTSSAKDDVDENEQTATATALTDSTAAASPPPPEASPPNVTSAGCVTPTDNATTKSSFGGWGGGGHEDAEEGGNGSEKKAWRLLGRSVVVALPGALEQQWHVDGAHVDLKVCDFFSYFSIWLHCFLN